MLFQYVISDEGRRTFGGVRRRVGFILAAICGFLYLAKLVKPIQSFLKSGDLTRSLRSGSALFEIIVNLIGLALLGIIVWLLLRLQSRQSVGATKLSPTRRKTNSDEPEDHQDHDYREPTHEAIKEREQEIQEEVDKLFGNLSPSSLHPEGYIEARAGRPKSTIFAAYKYLEPGDTRFAYHTYDLVVDSVLSKITFDSFDPQFAINRHPQSFQRGNVHSVRFVFSHEAKDIVYDFIRSKLHREFEPREKLHEFEQHLYWKPDEGEKVLLTPSSYIVVLADGILPLKPSILPPLEIFDGETVCWFLRECKEEDIEVIYDMQNPTCKKILDAYRSPDGAGFPMDATDEEIHEQRKRAGIGVQLFGTLRVDAGKRRIENAYITSVYE